MVQYLTKLKNKKGFTLVELMVVIAIIGVLVAIAIPVYNNITATAEQTTNEATARIIASAVTMASAQQSGAQPNAAQINAFLNDIEVTAGTDDAAEDGGWYVKFSGATDFTFEVFKDLEKFYPRT